MRMWPARTFVINDPIAESSTPLAPLSDFQRVLAGLYPELGGALPDLEQYAESARPAALGQAVRAEVSASLGRVVVR